MFPNISASLFGSGSTSANTRVNNSNIIGAQIIINNYYANAESTKKKNVPKVLGSPGSKNQNYIPRLFIEEKVVQILQRLTGPLIKIAITGLSGTGKSEFAKDFLYKTFFDKNIYQYAIWISRDKSIKDQVDEVILEMGVDPNLREDIKIKKLYDSFNSDNPSELNKVLIVVDDVEDFKSVKKYLPLEFVGKNCQFHLLVVSRSGNIDGFENIVVENIHCDSEIDIIYDGSESTRRLGKKNEVKDLLNALDGYPFVVALAAQVIGPLCSVEEYLKIFREYTCSFFEEKKYLLGQPIGVELSTKRESFKKIEKVFGILLDKIKAESLLAFELVSYLSVLSFHPFPSDFLYDLLAYGSTKQYNTANLSENNLECAIEILFRYGIVHLSYNKKYGQLITLNRLAGACFKRLNLNSFVNKSYLSQEFINNKFISTYNLYLQDSPSTVNAASLSQICWTGLEGLIHHVLIIGSKIVYSWDNKEEVELMYNAFYLIGLYHFQQRNVEGVFLAIQHINLIMGDCAYPGGTLFNGDTHGSGRRFLYDLLQYDMRGCKHHREITASREFETLLVYNQHKDPKREYPDTSDSALEIVIQNDPVSNIVIEQEEKKEKSRCLLS